LNKNLTSNKSIKNTQRTYYFGFNGQEKDDEVYGTGNLNTAEFWQYDTRIGRRWNVDPRLRVGHSPYSTFANSPIQCTDPKGDTVLFSWFVNSFDNAIHIIQDREMRKRNDDKDDGVFYVSAHSNSSQINNNGTVLTNAKDVVDKLMENDALSKAIKEGRPIVIIFNTCNLASNSYEENGKIIKNNDPLAFQISREFSKLSPNVTIKANACYSTPSGPVNPNRVLTIMDGRRVPGVLAPKPQAPKSMLDRIKDKFRKSIPAEEGQSGNSTSGGCSTDNSGGGSNNGSSSGGGGRTAGDVCRQRF
jgi:hypothetical protein